MNKHKSSSTPSETNKPDRQTDRQTRGEKLNYVKTQGALRVAVTKE